MTSKTAVVVAEGCYGVRFLVENKNYSVGELIDFHGDKYEVVKDSLNIVKVKEVRDEQKTI